MFREKRPTPVSVIGWAWVVIGALMLMSSTLAIVMALTTGLHGFPPWAIGLCLLQAALGVLGIVAGRSFLRLRAWARTVLEALSWLMCVFVLGFAVFWVANWIAVLGPDAPPGATGFGVVSGLFSAAFYGVPLGLMIYFLRGARVREAVE